MKDLFSLSERGKWESRTFENPIDFRFATEEKRTSDRAGKRKSGRSELQFRKPRALSTRCEICGSPFKKSVRAISKAFSSLFPPSSPLFKFRYFRETRFKNSDWSVVSRAPESFKKIETPLREMSFQYRFSRARTVPRVSGGKNRLLFLFFRMQPQLFGRGKNGAKKGPERCTIVFSSSDSSSLLRGGEAPKCIGKREMGDPGKKRDEIEFCPRETGKTGGTRHFSSPGLLSLSLSP